MDGHVLRKNTKFFLEKKNFEKKEVMEYIGLLREVLHSHNFLYYAEAAPVISDSEYDTLFSLLKTREDEYPDVYDETTPTSRVGTAIQEGYEKANHLVPLLSLKNSYNAEDILDRRTSQKKQLGDEQIATFVVEPKLDGSSVEVIYRNGKFQQAITRGDGYTGEDITTGAGYLHHLPGKIEAWEHIEEVRIRGEVVMPKAAFNQVNSYLASEGMTLFANPRNAAAGTLRQLDVSKIYTRGLVFYAHGLLSSSEYLGATTESILTLFNDVGFQVHPLYKHLASIEEVVDMCLDKDLENQLEAGDIETDGLVIKINETEFHDQLGATEHHPRWAIAFKYPTKQVSTEILGVTYQIGRTGVITPVAELQTVSLGGVLVSRASLHNFDMIAERDIRLYDSVWIQRSGEVIPYVIGPIVDVRTGKEEKIHIPEVCPSCGSPLVRDEGNVAVRCVSSTCDAKLKGQLNHFVSKKAANISGFGQGMIDIFYDAGLIKDITSIYSLMSENSALLLRSLPGVGAKKIAQLQKEIEKAKKLQFRRLLHGLSISYVGVKAAKLLEAFVASTSRKDVISLHEVRGLLQTPDVLLEIHGLGEQTVTAVVEYMSSRNSDELFAEMEKLGVVCLLPEIKDTTDGLLVGMVVVITGSFAFSRAEFQKLLEQEGARVTSSVTKKTSLLIAGENPGSKLQKATELNIPVMSFDEFEQKYSRFSELQNSSSGYQESSLFG